MKRNPSTRKPWRRAGAGLLATALAASVLAAATSSSSTAAGPEHRASSRHAASTARPTIVLVHGAFADAGGWSAEIAALQALGYDVIAPADPLRGLSSDAAYIRSVVRSISGPVILVGHSYGGAVITDAATGADNVVALVYIAAFIPAQGTSVATSYDPATYPGSLLGPDSLLVRPTANPVAPEGRDADLYIKADWFRRVFAADQSRTTAAVMAASQRPLSAFAFSEPSGPPAWQTLPSWDLVTLDDQAISPGGQEFMARRAGARISTIHSAHDVMVSHPGAVVRLIVTAAGSTS